MDELNRILPWEEGTIVKPVVAGEVAAAKAMMRQAVLKIMMVQIYSSGKRENKLPTKRVFWHCKLDRGCPRSQIKWSRDPGKILFPKNWKKNGRKLSTSVSFTYVRD